MRLTNLLSKVDALKYEELFIAEELKFEQLVQMGPAELKLIGVPLGVAARILKQFNEIVEGDNAKKAMESRQVEGGVI